MSLVVVVSKFGINLVVEVSKFGINLVVIVSKFGMNLVVAVSKFGINLVVMSCFLYLCKKNGMVERAIKNSILADYRRRKVIVLLGARQVGKTTLLLELRGGKEKVLSLNCDNADDVLLIEDKTTTELKHLLSPYELVFIDEAQRVKNIGLTLKKIGDLKLETQVVVTGPSSLDMANEISEPATGRL